VTEQGCFERATVVQRRVETLDGSDGKTQDDGQGRFSAASARISFFQFSASRRPNSPVGVRQLT